MSVSLKIRIRWSSGEDFDETQLFGVEHRNPNLFRNTLLGKLAPVTGAFVTGKGAAYLYTGIEAQYSLGPVKISPGFAPGYYEQGGGKNLGDVLEFKSELKVGIVTTVIFHVPWRLSVPNI